MVDAGATRRALSCAALSAWSLVVRSRRGTATERHQIK
jgi:hypothetical protein